MLKKIFSIQKIVINHSFLKTGKNQYANYEYLQLEEILPFIFDKSEEQGLMLRFNFDTASINEENSYFMAKLVITDLETGDNIINELPAVKLEKLPKMNLMQSLGAYITYAKKYLLMNAFFVMGGTDVDDLKPLEPVKKRKEVKLSDGQKSMLQKVLDEAKKENDVVKKSFLKKIVRNTVKLDKDIDSINNYITNSFKSKIDLKEVEL